MIPSKDWVHRASVAGLKVNRPVMKIDPAVQAERERMMAEREAMIEAVRAADAAARPGVGITTAKVLLADVTPDTDEPEAEPEAEPAAEPAPAAPAPKARAAKKA